MVLKCSECNGIISKGKRGNETVLKCVRCGREKVIKETKTIDMSATAGLSVIME